MEKTESRWEAIKATATSPETKETIKTAATAGAVILGFGMAVGIAQAVAAKTYALLAN